MTKDPEIKLFGRKIVLPANGGECAGESSEESGGGADCDSCFEAGVGKQGGRDGGKGDGEEKQEQADADQSEELCETSEQDEEQNPGAAEESQNTNAVSELDNDPKSPSTDDDVVSANHPETENQKSVATSTQQMTKEKPDKILPCPRCNSMDTKFCYYNNYNINQPRHFCKSCQRYWTAGGTMRNVPVGAGRRKNKISASFHCRHLVISETLHAAGIDATNGLIQPKYKPNGTVLSFGPDSPPPKSIDSALNISDLRGSHSCKNRENVDDCSAGSSITVSNPPADGGRNRLTQLAVQNVNVLVSPVPCIPGVPWAFPWNSAVPVPGICSPGYPLPYYPSPYWNCSVPSAWNVVPCLSVPAPAADQKAADSSPNSPLGKHSRKGELIKPNCSEGRGPTKPKSAASPIAVPKTLRIDDPEEAAKSSIWATMGINYDSSSRQGLFIALQPRVDEKKAIVTALPLLQFIPAALSRSISFQERA